MTTLCEAVQSELSCGAALSEAHEQHRASCLACQAHAAEVGALLEAMSPPASSALERQALAGLASAVDAEVRARARRPRRSALGALARYGLAAGLGALITTAALSPRLGEGTSVSTGPTITLSDSLPTDWPLFAELDELNQNDDEVSFEVAWPELE